MARRKEGQMNIEHRTPNIELRKEEILSEMRGKWMARCATHLATAFISAILGNLCGFAVNSSGAVWGKR
jgi:hypothetical protein